MTLSDICLLVFSVWGHLIAATILRKTSETAYWDEGNLHNNYCTKQQHHKHSKLILAVTQTTCQKSINTSALLFNTIHTILQHVGFQWIYLFEIYQTAKYSYSFVPNFSDTKQIVTLRILRVNMVHINCLCQYFLTS